MRNNNKNKINSRSNTPVNVPNYSSEHLSLRVTPKLKNYLRKQSNRHKLTITKYVLNIFDNHLVQHLCDEFPADYLLDNNEQKHISRKSKLEDSSWDGIQKVWNFFKCA